MKDAVPYSSQYTALRSKICGSTSRQENPHLGLGRVNTAGTPPAGPPIPPKHQRPLLLRQDAIHPVNDRRSIVDERHIAGPPGGWERSGASEVLTAPLAARIRHNNDHKEFSTERRQRLRKSMGANAQQQYTTEIRGGLPAN